MSELKLTPDPERTDRRKEIALLAARIYAGHSANPHLIYDDDAKHAKQCVGIALEIIKAAEDSL